MIEEPPPLQSKKRERPTTPTFEDSTSFQIKKKKQETNRSDVQSKTTTTTTSKRKHSVNASKEKKKKKKKKRNSENPLSNFLDMDPEKLKELYDVSMAYCGKCEEGGDMFCCSGCPGVYHPKCVGLDSVPEDDWYCDWCKSMKTNIQDITNSSKLKDKKRCMRVLSTLRKNDYASVFEHPVEIPGYNMFIKKPMCLSVVQRNLLSGVYDSDIRGLFRSDMELIFKNCMEFNQPKTGIWRLAQTLGKFYVQTEDS